MARKTDAAWLAALGTALMIMGAQAYGTPAQKAAPAQKPAVQKAAPAPKIPTTTLTGCLKMDGGQYQLTNVEGSQVEKNRSWKSGFIKKSSRNIEVVGASPAVKLHDQLGHQVSVVGTKDGETHLKASSIKRVAASCS